MEKQLGNIVPIAILLVAGRILAIRYFGGYYDTSAPADWVKCEGVVHSVYASGRGYKRGTIINVRYNYASESRSANLRRDGYREGTYNKGDSITIYVNPADPSKIK